LIYSRPEPEAAILLATYDFVNANKLFGYNLVTSLPEKKNEESPFASFLSLTSYLLQHAYRSERVATYSELNLSIIRVLVEEPVLCKRICSEEGKRHVRLCRQRQPHLPLVNGERVLATVIFDIMIDTMTHNLRRRLDVNLYWYAFFFTFFCVLIKTCSSQCNTVTALVSSLACSPTYHPTEFDFHTTGPNYGEPCSL
jgi:hypothetical protein